jgi:hypothetical protein
MMSHLSHSLREAIKTETDLFTLRVQQQVSRHCAIIESAAAFGAAGPIPGTNEDLQLQINEIKESLSALMGEIIGRRYGEASSICSAITADILPDEAASNVVVNKVQPDEIKEVHINFDNQSDGASAGSRESSAQSIDILVENTGGVVNEAAQPETAGAGYEGDEEECEIVHSLVKDDVVGEEEVVADVDAGVDTDVDEKEEDDAAEEEEVVEEEEALEVEEIEYNGVKYYKDSDNNVYACLDDGEVGEAVGTMSKKVAGKVLLYAA